MHKRLTIEYPTIILGITLDMASFSAFTMPRKQKSKNRPIYCQTEQYLDNTIQGQDNSNTGHFRDRTIKRQGISETGHFIDRTFHRQGNCNKFLDRPQFQFLNHRRKFPTPSSRQENRTIPRKDIFYK